MLNYAPQRRPSQPSRGPLRRSGAANDNARFRVIVPTNPRRLARLGGNLLKLNPYFRLAGMALDVLEVFQNAQPEGWHDLGPWVSYGKCAAPRSGPIVQINRSTGYPNPSYGTFANTCLAGQASSNPLPPFTVNDNHKSIMLGVGYAQGPLTRYQCVEAFHRPRDGLATDPTPWYGSRAAIALPPVRPNSWPLSIWPELAPPNAAPAFPRPRPWNKPNLRSINSPASNGNRSGIAAKSIDQVPNDWSVSVELGPTHVGAPKTHTLAPPAEPTSRSTDRERKAKMSPATILLLKGISMATEGLDLVNAIYKALPPEYRPKYRDTNYELRSATIDQKMKAIIENWDKIPIEDALYNIAADQLSDRIYAMQGRIAGANSKRLGIPYGVGQSGIGSRLRRTTYDYERDFARDLAD